MWSHDKVNEHGDPVSVWSSGDSLGLLEIGSLLDADDENDCPIVTTRRRIARVAALGVQVGQRHVQERREGDPAAWMFAPRRLYQGQAPVFACQDLAAFTRGIVLHATGEADADADEVDELLADDTHEKDQADIESHGAGGNVYEARTSDAHGLFTSTVWDPISDRKLLLFHAAIAKSRSDYEALLEARLGPRLAGMADVRAGYDPSDCVSLALVSKPIDEILTQIATDPMSPLATGVEVQLEQRFVE